MIKRSVLRGAALCAAVIFWAGCTSLSPEERFWNAIDNDAVLSQIDRDTVMQAGKDVCSDLRAGNSLYDVYRKVELGGVPSDQVTRLFMATSNICSDYYDVLRGLKAG
jgi:hypothetical protein